MNGLDCELDLKMETLTKARYLVKCSDSDWDCYLAMQKVDS